MPSGHQQDAEKVWAAVKRDYFAAVETSAGLRVELNDKRRVRLLNSWRMLCAVDPDVAQRLAAGLDEVALALRDAGDRRHEPRPLQVSKFLTQHEEDDDDEELGGVLTLGGAALQRRISEQFSRL